MAETEPDTDTATLDPDTGAAYAPDAIPDRAPAEPDAGGFIWGTGRRKSATARVRIRKGEGQFLVNGKEITDYFSELQDQNACTAPLEATQMKGDLDVIIKVEGGGMAGQADAVLLGVARALTNYDPALEPILRDKDYLTRDPREVERKKYGQPGARRKFQFSKR
jgi:small subunit ribosomal protein S9